MKSHIINSLHDLIKILEFYISALSPEQISHKDTFRDTPCFESLFMTYCLIPLLNDISYEDIEISVNQTKINLY